MKPYRPSIAEQRRRYAADRALRRLKPNPDTPIAANGTFSIPRSIRSLEDALRVVDEISANADDIPIR